MGFEEWTVFALFVTRSYDDQPDESIKMCQVLLEETDIDAAVRVGDIYGFMIEHYNHKANYNMVNSIYAPIYLVNR